MSQQLSEIPDTTFRDKNPEQEKIDNWNQQFANIKRPFYDRDKRQMFSGNTGIVVKSINKLKTILGDLQTLKQGGDVKQRFVGRLKGIIHMLDQQLDQSEMNLTEARVIHRLKWMSRKITEGTKSMPAQKLGRYTKGKNAVSLWENNGKILIVDAKSNSLQESKIGKSATAAQLESKGWVNESTDMIHMFQNAAGLLLKVKALNTAHTVHEITNGKGKVKKFKATLQDIIAKLKRSGFDEYTGANDNDLSLEPMEDMEPEPEENGQELMAGRRQRYRFQRNKLKY